MQPLFGPNTPAAEALFRARGPEAHGSAGLLAAMRNCPWGFDSAPATETNTSLGGVRPYDANERPACARWKAGDRVLAPWVRRSTGLLMLYERTGGPRAGEVAHAFLPEPRRRFARDRGFDVAGILLEHPDLADVDLGEGEGFRVLESREAWAYSDPAPGIEAITCKLCLSKILEVQGPRADLLIERAEAIRTSAVVEELEAERRQALLERGTCPNCAGELGRHDFEGLRVCRPCGFEWGKRVRSGLGDEQWELLNSTNRGTDAHT